MNGKMEKIVMIFFLKHLGKIFIFFDWKKTREKISFEPAMNKLLLSTIETEKNDWQKANEQFLRLTRTLGA